MHNIDAGNVKSALLRLIEGNNEYLLAKHGRGDISEEIRHLTHTDGQKPYAVVVCCSDSRVVPELIFMVGIGEIFTIRTAGNVVGEIELGSIEYAVEHLGVRLVLVVGHSRCGAVEAAISGDGEGSIKSITDEIKGVIGTETDPYKCEILNIENSIEKIKNSPIIKRISQNEDIAVVGGHYHNKSGQFTLINKDILE